MDRGWAIFLTDDDDDDDSAVEVVHHHLIKVSAAADDDVALCTVRQKNSDMDSASSLCKQNEKQRLAELDTK